MPAADSHLSPGTGLRLLSFDGGGIRAVSQALMVREMIHRIEADRQLTSPARVCDYFDMICGSGFGGLLAIMCGILEMTGDQLVEEFITLCKAVFSPDLDSAQRTVVLKFEVKRLIRSYSTGGEDMKMLDEDNTCKIFVCAVASQNASHPRLFRNYESRANRNPDCTVWEAALATIAMPALFAPIVIGKLPLVETFVGGEVGWNNPTDELTREAAHIFKDCHIACIISIGSGHPGHLTLSQGLSELFSSIALDCERITDGMERRFEGAPGAFWRLSVQQGLQNLAFDLSNLDILVSHTHSYLRDAFTTHNIDVLVQDIIRRPKRIGVDRISGNASSEGSVLHRRLCPQASQYFTGRCAEVRRLEEYFFSDSGSSCRIAVLYGIGGSGKTQVGLQFIQEHNSRFSEVFFVDASDRFTLENDFKLIATGVSNRPTLDKAFHLLRVSKGDWLLFFDNADDTTLDLRPYIKWWHGNVLITTRNREMRVHAPNCSILVDKLDPEDAKKLLLRGVTASKSHETNKAATEIVQQLGCLALAVSQARAFLSQDICTLSEYLPLYMQNRRRILEAKFIQNTDDYEHTVYTTWLISFEKLSSAAARLFELLCFLHHEAIPSHLFEDAWKKLDQEEEGAIPMTLVTFLSGFEAADSTWDTLRFRMLVKEILSFSLVEFDTANHTISLHPLVQLWAQSYFRHSQEIMLATQTLICLAVSTGKSQRDYSRRMSLLPHIRESAKSGLVVHYTLLSRASRVYSHGGMFRECAEVRQSLLSHKKQRLGCENLSTLTTMANLACTYANLGQYKDTLTLEEQVLIIRMRILGEEHPSTLTGMANLACTYSNLGRYQDALKLEEDVLVLRKRILGDEHPDTLTSMGNLAHTFSDLGQHKDALKLKEQALVLVKRILGDEHPDTLTSLANLAHTYSNLLQYHDALNLEVQVLELRRRVLGEEHPDTLTGMANLACTYSNLGQHHTALTLEEQVLVLRKRILGEEHPDTLICMANLAHTYSNIRQYHDALKLEQQVLALRKQILGQEHPDTLTSMGNLACTYSDLGQLRDALILEEQVVVLEKRVLGEEHPSTLTSMTNLARTYSDLNQHHDALKLERHVLKLRKRILGQEHPDTLISMAGLARTYSNLGQDGKALRLEEQVLALRKRLFGVDDNATVNSFKRVEQVQLRMRTGSSKVLSKSSVIVCISGLVGLFAYTYLYITLVKVESRPLIHY
ncbi:hypothetical protein DL96DRAFT_1520856 [Flagelloscypha sp. PMI_526]|nr:hypothetical protein DL96DRAFT_1520856 [Flagelloscypha sp. PMI_526]